MKILLSNGACKFHLAPAAVEMYKRSSLGLLITAGYPKPWVKALLKLCFLHKTRGGGRLLDREEKLPQGYVKTTLIFELLFQIARRIKRLPMPTKSLGVFIHKLGLQCEVWSFRYYAFIAKFIIQTCSQPMDVYHYRGGFGGASLNAARNQGMILVCDYSIAQADVLEFMVKNGGKYPPCDYLAPLDSLWQHIKTDASFADYLIVNSDFVKQTFVHTGFPAEKVIPIYWGIDDKFFEFIPRRQSPTKIDGRPIKFLFAGNIEYRKGGKELLEAFLGLPPDSRWHLDIAAGLDSSLASKAEQLFSQKNITYHGLVPRQKLAELMVEADVFVFPSLAEGSARTVFEALACGCFLIVTPNAGSIAQDRVHGIVIEPGEPSQLKEAILSVISGEQDVERIGKANAKLIFDEYRQSFYGDKLHAAYAQISRQNA